MNTDNIYKPGIIRAEAPKFAHLVHKNGKHRIIPLGFCWLGFLLPPVSALSEGLWRPFACSLLFFLADKITQAAVFNCEHTGFCAAVPFAALFKVIGFFGYLFTMGYFGIDGKKILIADLLKHGYFIEGSPRIVEPDECES